MGLRKQALALALVAAAIPAGCSLVTGYDGFAATGTVVKPACGKSRPERPLAATGGGDRALTGTMKLIRFQELPNAPPLGYNIDKLCTCPDKKACRSRGVDDACDLPIGSGIDNAAGQILRFLYPPGSAQTLTDSLKRGRNGMVVQIQNYNGLKDDPDVSVALYNVVGVNGKADGTGLAKFDGDDEMIVDDKSLVINTMGPQYQTNSAWVAGGVLVAELAFDLRLEVPNALIDASSVAFVPFKSATLIGKITIVGGTGLEMEDAQLVGRIAEPDLFAQISRIGLCQDSGPFPDVKKKACAALDLPVDPASDGKNVDCNALSLAIEVVITGARLGGHLPVNNGPSLCGNETVGRCD